MKKNNRHFIVFNNHLRLKRMWNFIFTGWGLVMVGALIAGSFFSSQLLWTPISGINMNDVINNQFKISNAKFVGTDTNGQPFSIQTQWAKQEYDTPNIITTGNISGTTVRIQNDTKITDTITAQSAQYDRKTKKITFIGNVRIDSDNGDKILTDKMLIQL